ncbi:MAG: hypothetical protein ACP5XB_02020 [Isosphaeraceae bacterium]
MVARLWWKEARMFWPIWAFLLVIAAAVQILVLHFSGDEARTGALAVLALRWTCLYAFAVAAASFAGERENRTLDLLDSLPIERWRLWTTKTSFAFVTTLAFGLVVLGLAAAGTVKVEFEAAARSFVPGVVIVLEVLGWGLFWSAFLGNALVTAALAVCATGLSFPILDAGFHPALPLSEQWGVHLALAVVTTITSAALFVKLGPPRKTLFPGSSTRLTSRASLSEKAVADRASVVASGMSSASRLAWQAIRQISRVWWWMFLIAIFAPVLLSLWNRSLDQALYWFLFQIGIAVVGGVGIFGSENPSKSYRFLAHHGIRPSLVWLVRIAVWTVGLGILFELTAIGFVVSGGPQRIPLASFVLVWFLALAVSVLCGMVIRRGITAGMVSVLLILTLAPVGTVLLQIGIISTPFLAMVPALFLAVSFVWTREWMLDRPGAAKWLKLAALLAVPFGLLFAAYVTDRVVSVPVLEPSRDARLFTIRMSAAIPTEENAADLYRQAGRTLTPAPKDLYQSLGKNWGDIPTDIKTWQQNNAKVLELIRQTAERPFCQFGPIEKQTFFSPIAAQQPPIGSLSPLVTLSVREHMAKGDLDGAWKDIRLLFRMAQHFGGAVPWAQAFTSSNVEKQALELTMVWAADKKQTALRLRSALETFRGLPKADPADPIRFEALSIENTAKLPRAELADEILRMVTEGRKKIEWTDALWTDVVTTPWELERARRAFRLLYASRIVETSDGRYLSDKANTNVGGYPFLALSDNPHGPALVDPWTLNEIEKSTPLVRYAPAPMEAYLRNYWRNEVGRRALVQILALRVWQLSHDGKLPDSLLTLEAEGLLPNLPTDPYKPLRLFGYVRSSGQKLLPLGSLDPINEVREERPLRPVENAWLLYSVGPDGSDDHAEKNDAYTHAGGDIVFPLADKVGGAKPGKTGEKQ